MAALCRRGLWKHLANPEARGFLDTAFLLLPCNNRTGAIVVCRRPAMRAQRSKATVALGQVEKAAEPSHSVLPASSQDDPQHGYYVYPNMHPGCKTEAMPRYPTELSSLGLLRAGDYIGTVAFAASGSITAAATGMDILGCSLVGTITAVGGGTLRDALLLNKKPFWIEENEYLWMSIGASLLTFYLWQHVGWDFLKEQKAIEDADSQTLTELELKTKYHGNSTEGALLWWGDTIGIGAFCVIGAMNGCRANCHPGICMICGMMTSTFGGLTRDVLCNLPSNPSFIQAEKDGTVKRWQGNGGILHSKSDLYATTALLGAGVYVLLLKSPVLFSMTSVPVRILAGAGSAMGLRLAASNYGLGLPAWDKMSWEVDSNKAR